ncbi:MAG TPA: 4-(cytidine 5'-diphospho)-2-C-methyl-D-erythritol kinase [Candidatus Rubrimentiphilum sp.]|nr:4-(cytidine 5'-diphospho)-2-C-methyl-D-erythritol kinase [Candidatus Rubrimentiphilum sp.]
MKAGVTLQAPAKINLSLEVLGRVAGGLHGLRSVMVPVDLCDELEIVPGGDALQFLCSDPALQSDNLVERAYCLLDLQSGAKIGLRKNIPVQAGLGGGSSDAAAVLLAAQRGAFESVPQIDYVQTATELGSDVPFFLVETAALVEGTGERVTALGKVPDWHAVIVKPPVSVSTRDAYAALDERERDSRPRNASASLSLGEALQRGDFDRVVELQQNDFHDVVSSTPEIAQALDMLRGAGARKPMLSGSGSAVYALARTAEERDRLAERIVTVPEFEIFACAFRSGAAWTR